MVSPGMAHRTLPTSDATGYFLKDGDMVRLAI